MAMTMEKIMVLQWQWQEWKQQWYYQLCSAGNGVGSWGEEPGVWYWYSIVGNTKPAHGEIFELSLSITCVRSSHNWQWNMLARRSKVNWSWRQEGGGPMPGVTPITHLVVLAVAEDNKSTWVDLMWQLGSATDYQLRPGQGCIIFLQTVLCRNIYILRKLLKWSWVTPSLTPVPSICIQA